MSTRWYVTSCNNWGRWVVLTILPAKTQAVFMAFSLDYSRTSHSRYHGNTQRRHADYNRLHPIATHRHRQTRTFQVAATALHDHGPTPAPQGLSSGKYRGI